MLRHGVLSEWCRSVINAFLHLLVYFLSLFHFFCVRLLRVKCQAFHILATDEFHFQVNRVEFFCYEFETSNYATTRINAMQLELEID